MEDTLGATRSRSLRDTRPSLAEAAVAYAEERHWDVSPGAWLVEQDGVTRCSCGDERCPMPGAHPVVRDWAKRASAGPGVVRRWWTENPLASVLLPTGRAFDAIDVPEVAGCLALARMERMGVPLGPVLAVPGGPGRGRRLVFLVLPGALSQLPDMLRRLGWGPGRLDLVGHGVGGWVVAPPTRVGAFGFSQWAREPNELNRWLPEAGELINPIAYACGREAPLLG